MIYLKSYKKLMVKWYRPRRQSRALSEGEASHSEKEQLESVEGVMDFAGKRRYNEHSISDSGAFPYGIVPCDCHLSYVGTQACKRKICSL